MVCVFEGVGVYYLWGCAHGWWDLVGLHTPHVQGPFQRARATDTHALPYCMQEYGLHVRARATAVAATPLWESSPPVGVAVVAMCVREVRGEGVVVVVASRSMCHSQLGIARVLSHAAA
jgi:hypothetical protein